MNPEILNVTEIPTIEAADLSKILHPFEENERTKPKKRKKISFQRTKTKKAIEEAAYQSRKSQFLFRKLSETLEKANDAVVETQFEMACEEFRIAYAIVQYLYGKTSMKGASVLEQFGAVRVVMAKECEVDEKLSRVYRDESLLVYSEVLRVYEVLLSDENVERVRLILKKMMHLFRMGEFHGNFWECPCIICSHLVCVCVLIKKMRRLANVWETTASRIASSQKELLAFVVYILRRRK